MAALHGSRGGGIVINFDKPESTRLAGETVPHYRDGVDGYALQLMAFDPRSLFELDAHAPRRGRALRAPHRAERGEVADRIELGNMAGERTYIVL